MAPACLSTAGSLSAAFSALAVCSSRRSNVNVSLKTSFFGSATCHASATTSRSPVVSCNKTVRRPATPAPVQVQAKEGYKCKTHKASAKRFRVTGSGKVMRRKAWRAHLLSKKSTKRKNRLAGTTEVFRGDIDKIVGAMPYLKVKRINRLPREETE